MFVWFWKLQVDVVISEPALDTCLFLIGALEFAGPYTLRQSPVLANRCLVIHLFWFCGWWVSSGGGGTNGIGQIMLKEMFFGQEKMVLICWLESAGWQSYGGWTSLLFWSWKCKARWFNWVLGVRCFSYKVYTKYTPACLPACSTVCSLFSSFLAFSNGVNKSTETLLCKRVLYSCLYCHLDRHTKSRRDLTSAVVASSVKISLQKGGTTSSAVEVSLADPGVRATRTRLELGEGNVTPSFCSLLFICFPCLFRCKTTQ